MVFVKVRETYDLQTVKNKMTVIGIHTPNPDIIKKNYPGLLMQCRAYRPVGCDVRLACASMLPMDPLGVGTSDGDVAPEDMFNPILYKAMSNKGMSQLEARIQALGGVLPGEGDLSGQSAEVEVDGFTSAADEFPIYYGLLSNTHDWKHASPQAGLSMTNLRPLVYDVLHNVGDTSTNPGKSVNYPQASGAMATLTIGNYGNAIVGDAHPMPFINCTNYSTDGSANGYAQPGFNLNADYGLYNCSVDVPWVKAYVGCLVIPPSKLHELFFRCVIEWRIEFSSIRPISEITDWNGLTTIGNSTHYQNYSYPETKKAVTGESESILDKSDTCMVSANVDVKKVM